MVLTTEQIDAEAFARWGEMKGAPLAMCRGFARAIEAEVRKQDEALIRQVLEALEQSHATLWEEDDDPSRPAHAAIAAARARLLEADLAKLTERGAVAWKGIDAQDLRDEGQAMTLPYDVARCPGRITARPLGQIAGVRVTSGAGHSECVRCRRREPGRPDNQTHMQPPAFVRGKCPQRIEP